MKTIRVNLNEDSYDIAITTDFSVLDRFVSKYDKVVIVTDENVDNCYGNILDKYSAEKLVLPAGEQTKSHKHLIWLYEQFLNRGVTRSDLIVALGGGVIGDLTGYAAATFLRGVDFIQIPTSLLAQVDSSVGGKVAVNLPAAKNIVGSFYQPKFVFINPDFLDTLHPRYFADGMAEVIKYGAIKSRKLFDMLGEDNIDMSSVIEQCCDIKRQVVEVDQFDTGERMILNFGHTLGHSIEQYLKYEKYSHGEAVAIGMYHTTRVSEKMGISKEGTAEKIKQLLVKYKLPYECDLLTDKLLATMKLDKKADGKDISIILLEDIGKSIIKKIPKGELIQYMGAV